MFNDTTHKMKMNMYRDTKTECVKNEYNLFHDCEKTLTRILIWITKQFNQTGTLRQSNNFNIAKVNNILVYATGQALIGNS